jgi:hypothetical protein
MARSSLSTRMVPEFESRASHAQGADSRSRRLATVVRTGCHRRGCSGGSASGAAGQSSSRQRLVLNLAATGANTAATMPLRPLCGHRAHRTAANQGERRPTEPSVLRGFRPCSLAFTGVCGTNQYGANRDRTGDLLLAKQALSQLSYGPATHQFRRTLPARRSPFTVCLPAAASPQRRVAATAIAPTRRRAVPARGCSRVAAPAPDLREAPTPASSPPAADRRRASPSFHL